MSADERTIDQTLVTCRIIAGALVFGVVAFATVAIVLRLDRGAEAATLLSSIGAGLAAVAIVVRQVVLGVMSGRIGTAAAGSTTTGAIALYMTRMIIGLAILEAAAFFNVIAYLLEGHWWSLAVAAGLVAFMIASFPTRGRLRQWVEDREQLRQIGGERT